MRKRPGAGGKVLLGADGRVKARLHHKERDPETGATVEHTTEIEVRAKGGVSGEGSAEVVVDEHGGRVRVKGRAAAGGELDVDVAHQVDVSQGDVHVRSEQHAHARAFAGGEASGAAEVEVGPDGARARVGGEVFAGARAAVEVEDRTEVDGGLGKVGVANKVKVHVEAGAGAEAHVRANVGPHGAGVDAHVGAFAGAKAGVSSKSGISVEGFDIFSVQAHVEGLAGAGVEAAVHANIGEDGLTLGGDADASTGIGAGGGVTVKFNPLNAVKAADAVAHKTIETLSHAPQDPLGTLGKLTHDAEALFAGLLPLPKG